MLGKTVPLVIAFVSTVGAATASAATATASMNVSATVIASCTITPHVMASTRAALSAGPAMCAAPAASGIVARRPQITTEHDATAGVTRIVFAF